jgi:hypothetical protein
LGIRFLMLISLACGLGIYLGLHFGVLALLPFSVLGAGALLASSWMAGQDLFLSAGGLILPLIFLQAGYFLGLISREVYAQLLTRLNISPSKQI